MFVGVEVLFLIRLKLYQSELLPSHKTLDNFLQQALDKNHSNCNSKPAKDIETENWVCWSRFHAIKAPEKKHVVPQDCLINSFLGEHAAEANES